MQHFDSDEFVLCARYGELEEMKELINNYLQSIGETSPSNATLRDLFTRKDSDLNTALHMAAANGHVDILKYLIPYLTPGDIGIGNQEGSTALHWAAVNGQVKAVEMLLAAGADATQKNNSGRSAVTVGEQQGQLEAVQLLLKSFEPEEDDREEEGDAENEADEATEKLAATSINK
ncbi:hypothetical protein HK098_001074 [Nowakowskiella sp. JEL0407]|nr:hypothetical protein HK098_001074 [Nowakowskiella sp. JEL0407]